MGTRFLREVASLGLAAGPPAGSEAAGILPDSLPEPARRYLQCMRVAGRAREWSFRLGWTGRFRTRPKQRWMPCEAWQYNSLPAMARIFHIRIRFAGMVPVTGRDTYAAGRGRMRIRLLDLLPIGEGAGEEFDIGELVTWLNDAVLLAPSMLLIPPVRWSPVDRDSFEISLTDHGRTVSGRVTVEASGAPVRFTTEDRFLYDPAHPKVLVRTRWSTPVFGWQVIGGRPMPVRAQAVWNLPEGPFEYADLQLKPATIAFDVPPGK